MEFWLPDNLYEAKSKILPRTGHKGPEGGVEVWLYCFFISGTRWRWVVNSTPWPLYPWEWPGTHCVGCWVGPRAGLDGCGKSLSHRDSIPDRPAHSKSLYRQLYRPTPDNLYEGLCGTMSLGAWCLTFQAIALVSTLRGERCEKNWHETGTIKRSTHATTFISFVSARAQNKTDLFD